MPRASSDHKGTCSSEGLMISLFFFICCGWRALWRFWIDALNRKNRTYMVAVLAQLGIFFTEQIKDAKMAWSSSII